MSAPRIQVNGHLLPVVPATVIAVDQAAAHTAGFLLALLIEETDPGSAGRYWLRLTDPAQVRAVLNLLGATDPEQLVAAELTVAVNACDRQTMPLGLADAGMTTALLLA